MKIKQKSGPVIASINRLISEFGKNHQVLNINQPAHQATF